MCETQTGEEARWDHAEALKQPQLRLIPGEPPRQSAEIQNHQNTGTEQRLGTGAYPPPRACA